MFLLPTEFFFEEGTVVFWGEVKDREFSKLYNFVGNL